MEIVCTELHKKGFAKAVAAALSLMALAGCQTTKLTLKPQLMQDEKVYSCLVGSQSYLAALDGVIISDMNGKEHDRVAVITSNSSEVMKDYSRNITIQYAEVIGDDLGHLYYRLKFNTEVIDGWMEGSLYLLASYNLVTKELNEINKSTKARCIEITS